VEVVDTLPQGRTAAAQCGLFTYKSVPVIFEPPCTFKVSMRHFLTIIYIRIIFIVETDIQMLKMF